MMVQDLRVDQLPVGPDVVAVVGVAQLRGHVRHVQVLVYHQGCVHWDRRCRMRLWGHARGVHDFAVRVLSCGGHPGRVLLDLGHRVHLAMVERLEMPSRRTCK